MARRSRRRSSAVGFTGKVNAPKMITVIAAIVLTVAGVSRTVLPIEAVNDLLAQYVPQMTRDHAYIALLASPLLLIAGSLFRGL